MHIFENEVTTVYEMYINKYRWMKLKNHTKQPTNHLKPTDDDSSINVKNVTV